MWISGSRKSKNIRHGPGAYRRCRKPSAFRPLRSCHAHDRVSRSETVMTTVPSTQPPRVIREVNSKRWLVRVSRSHSASHPSVGYVACPTKLPLSTAANRAIIGNGVPLCVNSPTQEPTTRSWSLRITDDRLSSTAAVIVLSLGGNAEPVRFADVVPASVAALGSLPTADGGAASCKPSVRLTSGTRNPALAVTIAIAMPHAAILSARLQPSVAMSRFYPSR